MNTDEETGLPLVGGPLDPKAAEETFEVPLPPQVIVQLKAAEEAHGNAQALAADVGISLLQTLRFGMKAMHEFDETKNELKRCMDRAAKSTGVGQERVRGFDLVRGVATVAKNKSN